MEVKNSLARIKLWLDLPYYIKLVRTEKRLDEFILASGICESDVVSDFNKTTDLGQLFKGNKYTEVSYTSIEKRQERTKQGYKTVEIATYSYKEGVMCSAQLNRAILNKKNKELPIYGYDLYVTAGSVDSFYVKYNEDFSLYIDYEAYLKNDFKKVNESILRGLQNTADCNKKLSALESSVNEVFDEIKESDLYINILKLS